MNELSSNRNPGAGGAAGKLSPSLQLAQARGHRHLRIAVPTVPRRQLCQAKPKVRAALRAAEHAFWLATGGDFLHSDWLAGTRR